MSRALSIQWVDADPPTKSRGQDGTISRQLTGRKPQTARYDRHSIWRTLRDFIKSHAWTVC